LFGTAENGGTASAGTLFEWVQSTGTLSVLVNFSGSNGAKIYGALVRDSSGNLFGTTLAGGASHKGTLFEWVQSSGTLSTLDNFSSPGFDPFPSWDGHSPVAGLIADSSGNLYGTTPYGGTYADGAVFEWVHSTGTLTVLANFNGTNGA